jgi:hypothetical protein
MTNHDISELMAMARNYLSSYTELHYVILVDLFCREYKSKKKLDACLPRYKPTNDQFNVLDAANHYQIKVVYNRLVGEIVSPVEGGADVFDGEKVHPLTDEFSFTLAGEPFGLNGP